MKTLFKTVSLVAAVLSAVLLVSSVDAQPASGNSLLSPIYVLNTETATVTGQVTNKVIPYNVTSYAGTNAPIDIGRATYVGVTFHTRYTTTSIPSTNTTYTFQFSNDKVNWHNVQAVAVSGNTTDGAYQDTGTNYNALGFRWMRLYSVLPLAPMTNSQVLVNLK